MGKTERSKGRRGQTEAKHVLEEYNYRVTQITCGISSADFIAYDEKQKCYYAVEVKNQKAIKLNVFIAQAKLQAKVAKMKWLLMARLHGGYGWLILKSESKTAEIYKCFNSRSKK